MGAGKRGWAAENGKFQQENRMGIARGPKSEVGGLKRYICVDLCSFAVVFGPRGRKPDRNGPGRAKNGRFHQENRKGWGLDPVFLCVSCSPAYSGGIGAGRSVWRGRRRPAEAKNAEKWLATGLGGRKTGDFSRKTGAQATDYSCFPENFVFSCLEWGSSGRAGVWRAPGGR